MKGQPLNGVQVFVRHQDLTPEIVNIVKVTKDTNKGAGLQMPIPVSQQEIDKGNLLGWAMVTGVN